MTNEAIQIRGARTHNLQNLNVVIPRDQLVVITGVSGSGKSSLAFDTVFAEGERRYLDNLSAHTRLALQTVARPDVDEIDGLPPTLAVAQRGGRASPRSTLGTLTEIHDYLRIVFARVGTPHCPQCGREITTQPVETIVDRILALDAGRKVMLLAPVVRGKKGQHKDVFERIVRNGFVRARVNGQIVDAAEPPALRKSQPHSVEAVIDRIVVKDGLRSRLMDSVHLAIKQGEGTCLVSAQEGEGWNDELYSSRFACPDCQISFLPIEPATFSFNTAAGACPTCDGLGLCPSSESATSEPSDRVCPDCAGSRHSPLARAVRWRGQRIHELLGMTAMGLMEQVSRPPEPGLKACTLGDQLVLDRLLPEICKRLEFLDQVGLSYLTLDRAADTLSGGELQRARLARCLGTGLLGMCYVLDEPTQGLHPRDTERLLGTLRELRNQGNTVIVVEHDPEVMRAADWLIDIGPGAGKEGGRLIAEGTPAAVARNPRSVTGRFLDLTPALDREGRAAEVQGTVTRSLPAIEISNAARRNLKCISARFPLGRMTCVTGVSGSGKTTLVMETLVPLVRHLLREVATGLSARESAPPAGLAGPGDLRCPGSDTLARLIVVDQSPLGRTGRSNPATASGVWDHIRRLFARTRDARLRGFGPRRFSFNESNGRCAACRGTGTRRFTAASLVGLDMPCPECRGSRFNAQTLQVRFKGRSVADVLNLRIDEAVEVFGSVEPIRRILAMFAEMGLGYLTLGQPAPTLSGGEGQRIKLASELSQSGEWAAGQTLYVLDEPTTGLHPADVERLVSILRKLAAQGQTVIVVEHHLGLIAAADWIVDLGPEAGDGGGRVIAEGPPGHVASVRDSHTGQSLRRILGSS